MFTLATSKAAHEMSVAIICVSNGSSFANVIAMHPLPVPMSAIFSGPSRFLLHKKASSTRISVSARGIRTALST